jgi:hypothetical protein
MNTATQKFYENAPCFLDFFATGDYLPAILHLLTTLRYWAIQLK